MKTFICASKEHEIIINNYLTMHKELIREISNESKYRNYMDVFNVVIDYHNNYGSNHRDSGNWYDWIMVIPINISVLSNGFLAAIETKRNSATVRSYRVLINNMVHDVSEKLEKIERVYD
jgi:hypothetical protein